MYYNRVYIYIHYSRSYINNGVYLGVIWGLYGDNGKDNGNDYNKATVQLQYKIVHHTAVSVSIMRVYCV